MPVFLLKDEKKIADVITRAFGKVRTADLPRVEAALLRANPHLTGDGGIRSGVGVVVPRLPGLEVAPRAQSETGVEVVDELVADLERYHHELEAAARQEKTDLTALGALYKSKELQRAVHDLPEAAEQMKKVVAATKARIEDHATTDKTLKHLGKTVVVLKKLGETLV